MLLGCSEAPGAVSGTAADASATLDAGEPAPCATPWCADTPLLVVPAPDSLTLIKLVPPGTPEISDNKRFGGPGLDRQRWAVTGFSDKAQATSWRCATCPAAASSTATTTASAAATS